LGFLLINSASALRNVARNMLRPGYLPEMCRKVLTRLRERNAAQERQEAIAWCKAHESDGEAWANALNPALWAEAMALRDEQEELCKTQVDALGFPLAGGGFYPMLYFLTRLYKPNYILETGVAAGHSSRGFLKAIERNGVGHLWSSDFPLFRLENPDQFIGVMVETELRKDWTFLIQGDRQNLPTLLSMMPRVDLFHFDSDKSRAGRNFAWTQVKPKLSKKCVVIFDDVQDNFHFLNDIIPMSQDWKLFAFEGKWIGIVLPG
jgi:predicted O-methyltransferase YrrM